MTALAELLDGAVRGLEQGRARIEGREIELSQADRYRRDPVAWIDDHVTIASKFDAGGGRVRVRPLKMRLFPDQHATIAHWIDLQQLEATGALELRNLLMEKSRQIGETWVFAAMVAWLLHYHRTRGLFMSLRAAEVANRGWTIDSFFGRVKYVNDRLDPAKVPGLGRLVFRPSSTDPAAIENLHSGALVLGECQRDDPGRGSTFDWALVDEAAHVTHGELVHAAIDDACVTGKVYLSTPKGDDTMHARLCDERPHGWGYLRLHWSTHPVYGVGAHTAGELASCHLCQGNRAEVTWDSRSPRAHRYPGKLTSPWYDQAVIGKTDEQVAGELDIDRAGALGARVYSEFENGTHLVETGIPYEPVLPVELAWDFGLDVTSVVVIQPHPAEVRVIGLFEAGDLYETAGTPDQVALALRPYLVALGVPDTLVAMPESLGIRAVGDPAGGARSTQTGKSDVAAYRSHGFAIGKPPSMLLASVQPSVQSVKGLLLGRPKLLQVCGVNAREFASHMRNNVWPMDATGQRRVGSTTPHDNVHNHACRAFAYWAVATHPPAGDLRESRMTVAEGVI